MSSASKLCRRAGLCVVGALVVVAQGLPNSLALTVAPGQTELGSFELTIPAMVKTATEVSMITVTQVSVQTTTVSALTTVTGLCAATTPSTLAISSTPVTSGRAASSSLPSLQALAALPSVVVQVPPAGSNASEVAIDTISKATPSAAVQLLDASPEQCQCQCLCPASAFLAYGSMVAPPANSVSTFQTITSRVTSLVTSLVTAGQPDPTLVISASPPAIPSATITSPVVSSPSTASESDLPGGSSISRSASPSMDAVTVALNIRDLKQNGIL